jgi:hypothetical protein
MVHIQASSYSKSLLVIIGGRNDDLWDILGQNCFSDINILDTNKLVWTNVIANGCDYIPRYGFSVSNTDNSLFIVGGITNGNLLPQEPFSLLIDVDKKTLDTFRTMLTADQMNGESLCNLNKSNIARITGPDVLGHIHIQSGRGNIIDISGSDIKNVGSGQL